jgi:hypothetical protein
MKSLLQNLVVCFSSLFLLYACGGGGKNIESISLYPVGSSGEFQYIDAAGQIVINPQFSEATIFRDGVALVKTSGDGALFGYISEKGEYEIMPNYTQATVFSEGLAWVVTEGGAIAAIDSKGEIKFTLQDAAKAMNFSEGLAAFSMFEEGDMKWGFINKEGNIVINPQFLDTRSFSNGMCAIANADKKWGFINEKGELVINYQFDDARDMMNGYAIVFTGNKAGVINSEGKYVINPQYQDMRVDGRNYQVMQNNRWGWCNSEGKIIINPQFSNAYPFHNNHIAAVRSGKDWGYADSEGKLVINPQFDEALPYNGDVALVISGRNYGLIDREGKYVVNPQYNKISVDLVRHVLGGRSPYETVESEFFNVAAIARAVDASKPQGLALNCTVQDLLDKFNVSENDFSRYSSEHSIFYNQKITNDAYLSFSVIAKPFESQQGGLSSKKGFNPSAPVRGFIFRIGLTGNDNNQEDEVLGAIESSLAGFTPSPDNADGKAKEFSNATHSVRLRKGYSEIFLSITEKKSDK